MDTQSIFLDSSGRRAQYLRLIGLILLLVGLLLSAAFAISMVVRPQLPTTKNPVEQLTGLKPAQSFAAKHLAAQSQAKLLKIIHAEESLKHVARILTPASQIAAAYYAPWRTEGIDSFRNHADQLTDVYAVWLRLSADGSGFDATDWDLQLNPRRKEFEDIAAEHHVHVIPVLANAAGGDFTQSNAAAMLADPAKSQALRTALLRFVEDHGYDGLQIDFENLDIVNQYRLAHFLKLLRDDLAPNGKSLSVTVQTEWDKSAIKSITAACDYVVGMIYDAHDDKDEPGPIAPATFVNEALQSLATSVGPNKLVVGFGVYGYDWTNGKPGAAVLSFSDAMGLAARMKGGLIDFDDTALNPTFEYQDSTGKNHEVWFQDGVTVLNQLKMSKPLDTRGAVMWQLGSEDPSVWNIFGKGTSLDTSKLNALPALNTVQFSGDGELLTVTGAPQTGARQLEVNSSTGLIIDSQYLRYPSGYQIARQGAAVNKIALTFDDGPDAEYTPQVLAVLRKYKVPATFFVIGENASEHPALVRQMLSDGNEIGSHSYTHPNMGKVSDVRAELELNATQRALESITGRTVRLFRPPYNADAEPRSREEVLPVVTANRLGYIVAGESIDPLDWYTQQRRADGSIHKLTPDDIVNNVVRQLGDGNTILLHDSGGDRSATVSALDKLIPLLRSKGYSFTTMGALGGMSTHQTMPLMDKSQLALVGLDRVSFYLAYGFQHIITIGFILAIALGLVRILMITGLALANHKHQALPALTSAPTVDVVIAAYNEEKVIVATINSVLESNYPALGIIVVDDGSKDSTSAAVKAAFANNHRVKLIEKTNGGKASALNLALASSQADIIVGVDADTQLHSNAVDQLVRHFSNPAIVAVAGNVKVGNRVNMLTRWQSLEYIVSQNLDRVAYEALDCITVVPGAIGAWRRQAVLDAGGYQTDTLAEDMDLTWRLQRAGGDIANETRAIAYTEAPDAFGALFKQRFRWTFGTLQCLWKHRAMTFRNGAFGWIALPSLWLFQIAAQLLAPFVDLQLLWATGSLLAAKLMGGGQADLGATGLDQSGMMRLLGVWLAFLLIEWLAGLFAFLRDKENPRDLLLLPLQRFIYRQIMYLVLWKALGRALAGLAQSWGKLDRKASVMRDTVPPAMIA